MRKASVVLAFVILAIELLYVSFAFGLRAEKILRRGDEQ